MEKNKKWKLVASICLGLSSILIIAQVIVRNYDNKQKHRRWDEDARYSVVTECIELFDVDLNDQIIKERVNNICKCYLEKIEINYSFYQYNYYVKSFQHDLYLDSCEKNTQKKTER